MQPRVQGWVRNEFATLVTGSKRLFTRFLIVMTMLSEQPDKSAWLAAGSRGQAKAAYRMLANKDLTADAVISAHRDAISARMAETNAKRGQNGRETVLLAVQDTMSVNYDGHKKTEGLGFTGNNTRGVSVHSCLLLDMNGVPLGVICQNTATRPEAKQPGTHSEQRKRPIEEKESNRWLETMREAAENAPKGAKLIHVADREGDIYELFALAQSTGELFVIRAVHDRLDSNNGHIIQTVDNSAAVGIVYVNIPVNHAKKQKERVAILELRSGSFDVKRPKTVSATAAPKSVALNIVIAEEKDPPEGIEPIKWILLTNLPVETPDNIIEVIQIYRKRWKIERFHFVLKSGCAIEKLQQRSFEGLSKMILLYSIIAIHIMALTYLARTAPDAPATLLFEDSEIEILWKAANRTKVPPQRTVTISEAAALVASLGGFMGAPSDGPPGLKVIWNGLDRFYTLCTFAEFLGP